MSQQVQGNDNLSCPHAPLRVALPPPGLRLRLCCHLVRRCLERRALEVAGGPVGARKEALVAVRRLEALRVAAHEVQPVAHDVDEVGLERWRRGRRRWKRGGREVEEREEEEEEEVEERWKRGWRRRRRWG